MKKRKLILNGAIILFLWLPCSNYAQTVKRQCFSSYGSSDMVNKVLIRQTVGQCYNTTNASSESKTVALQGFQQSETFKVESMMNSEQNGSLNLTVYPNPASYSVTIQSDETIENSIVNVTDLNGKLIFSEKTQLLKYNFNCADWNNGSYIITVSDGNQNKSSYKLIINK